MSDIEREPHPHQGDIATRLRTKIKIIHGIRIGCLLHVLHLAVNAGMECEFFMGPLGKGSWHEWQRQHLVSLLGMVWYNLARSESSNTTWAQFKKLVEARFGVVWKRKFVRPAETRWMVIWEGAAAVEERWDEVSWIFNEWAPRKLLGTPFSQYWARSMVMLKNPLIRLHAKFASSLGEVVLFWAYHWLRGKGGYFLKRDGKDPERLPPGMRFTEAADFILEVEGRLEECRSNPAKYFSGTLDWAKQNLDEDSVSVACYTCTKSHAQQVCAPRSRSSQWTYCVRLLLLLVRLLLLLLLLRLS